ncbi:MAG TPA: PEP-CTERM sorting domain-containing protein [Bryobacteraceae bacterium]|nr:PEP-CTERM sorting domain-containing protein [Bryobacteraceae bacterium]
MTTARVCFIGAWFICALGATAFAGTISFSGSITQSTIDGTGPASNNPALNDIQDSEAYAVTLIFSGSIAAPGLYDLTGSSLTFTDAAVPVSESAFDSIALSITQTAGMDEFTLLGCLTSGSGCNAGNQLDANFQIPEASFNDQNIPAAGLDQPRPLDLLEDDGVADFQGSITGYSGPAAVPEPSSVWLMGIAAAGLLWIKRRGQIRRKQI